MKTTEHIIKFLFSVNFIGHGPVCFDDIEALLKLSLTILSDHIGLEFCKLTPRNVNHLLITWFTKFAWWFRLLCALILLIVFIILVSLLRCLSCPIIGNGTALLAIWSIVWVVTDFANISGFFIKVSYIIHVHLVKQCWVLTIFWFIVSVYFEGSHLFLKVHLFFGVVLSLLLLLFLCFLLGLNSSELIEHILIM